MPTYEFRCPDGTIIERIFKMSEVPDAIPVPDGQGMAVRIISGGADLIFKGSGFYITDYGKDGKKDQRPDASKSGDAKPSEAKEKTSASSESGVKAKGAESGDKKPAKTEPKSKPPTPPSGAAA